jgi:hypothetical protein
MRTAQSPRPDRSLTLSVRAYDDKARSFDRASFCDEAKGNGLVLYTSRSAEADFTASELHLFGSCFAPDPGPEGAPARYLAATALRTPMKLNADLR